jgi:hypothetical protein
LAEERERCRSSRKIIAELKVCVIEMRVEMMQICAKFKRRLQGAGEVVGDRRAASAACEDQN